MENTHARKFGAGVFNVFCRNLKMEQLNFKKLSEIIKHPSVYACLLFSFIMVLNWHFMVLHRFRVS